MLDTATFHQDWRITMIVVGITGQAGSGKTTLANMMLDLFIGSKQLNFADNLKKIAESMGWNGKKDEKGRRLLQLLGTECGRQCISENIWVSLWEDSRIKLEKRDIPCIICGDVRFANEAEHIHKLDGSILRVIGRRGPNTDFEHESERGIPNLFCDYIIDNTGTMDQLLKYAISISMNIKEKYRA
jgi:energy-coupling factor transporter ATP-binding protein EcfA2